MKHDRHKDQIHQDLQKNYKRLQRRVFVLEQAVEALLERDHQYLCKFPAFNDQVGRQAIFISLIQSIKFDFIAETGTKWANTTSYIAQKTDGLPIFTSELVRESYLIARERLKHFDHVTIENVDSRELIRTLSNNDPHGELLPLFYLDAHWYEDLPLFEEVDAIANHWSDFVLLIDDFKVPDDLGYYFDDYGNGKSLTLEYLSSAIDDHNLKIFFPVLNSSDETGAQRGCVILSSDYNATKSLRSEKLLREFTMGS